MLRFFCHPSRGNASLETRARLVASEPRFFVAVASTPPTDGTLGFSGNPLLEVGRSSLTVEPRYGPGSTPKMPQALSLRHVNGRSPASGMSSMIGQSPSSSISPRLRRDWELGRR